jgi:hypothetical protein
MCGVGKFMSRWKKRDSTACPRCGNFEDSIHVWKCHGCNADQVWSDSIDKLRQWMEDQDTDPDLGELLLDMLRSWRNDTPLRNTPAYGLQLLLTRQQELGGSALLEGRLSFEWEACQQAYLTFIRSKRSSKRWITQLIIRLWDTAWDLWDHRNGILHQQTENHVTLSDNRYLDQRVHSMYSKLLEVASQTDRYLTQFSFLDLLDKPRLYKKTWLMQAEEAVNLAQTQVRSNQQRRLRELFLMRRRLRSWLLNTHN